MSRLPVSCATLIALSATVVLGPPAEATTADQIERVSTAPADCTADDLPIPAGYTRGWVEGGDPTGRHVFGWVEGPAQFERVPAVWHVEDGTMEVVDLGYVNRQELTDAAPDGTLTGLGQSDGQPGEAFVVRPDGTHEVLDHGDAFQAEAWAIDNDGTVAGFLRDDGSDAAIWPAVDGPPEVLRRGPADDNQPSGIAQGRVIGVVYDQASGYVWSGPKMKPKELPNPDPQAFVRTNEATGKYATGTEDNPGTGHYAVLRWNLKKRTVQAYEIGMSAQSINNRGVIGGGDGTRPLLLDGDQMQVLPQLVTGRASGVNHVSNGGDAFGYGLDSRGDVKPVAWSCS